MDRRIHARQPISIGALVHPQKGRSWLCAIRDFCQTGMLLVGTGVKIIEYAAGGLSREEIAARLAKLEAAIADLPKPRQVK